MYDSRLQCQLRVSVVLLLLSTSIAATSPYPIITGTVAQAGTVDTETGLRVVAYSRSGVLADSASVTSDGSFYFYSLPIRDGDYVLELQGSKLNNYHRIFIKVANTNVVYMQTRSDILVIPSRELVQPKTGDPMLLQFVPYEEANYLRVSPPWRIRDIWKYRIRILQLAAVAFVVWFPHVLKSLDKELREELTGEKELDFGDPNKHIKALTLLDQTANEDTAPTAQRPS